MLMTAALRTLKAEPTQELGRAAQGVDRGCSASRATTDRRHQEIIR